MRLKAWIEQEVEVDVPLAELLAELPGLGAPASVEEAKRLVSRCHACLRHIPVEIVAAMPDSVRAIIGDGLHQEAVRYYIGNYWRAMAYAPVDGTKVELLIRHATWWTAHKLDPEKADDEWEQIVVGHWIDHNGGGWTWAGMAGMPIGWRPLP